MTIFADVITFTNSENLELLLKLFGVILSPLAIISSYLLLKGSRSGHMPKIFWGSAGVLILSALVFVIFSGYLGRFTDVNLIDDSDGLYTGILVTASISAVGVLIPGLYILLTRLRDRLPKGAA